MVADVAVGRVCVNHPERDAFLVCTRCGRWHCGDCARPLTERYNGPTGCAHCDGILRKGEIERAPDDNEQLFWRIASGEGALMIFLLSLPGLGMGLGGLFMVLSFFMYTGIVGGYCLQTIDHLAAREPGLPFSSELISWGAIMGKALRSLAVVGVAVGPALVVLLAAPSLWPLGLVLLALGVALAPASYLAGVVTRSVLNQLWPLVWWEVVQRAPRAYVGLLGAVYGSVALWASTTLLLSWLLEPLFPLWSLLGPFVHTTFALWLACIFGRYLQREGAAYGYVL